MYTSVLLLQVQIALTQTRSDETDQHPQSFYCEKKIYPPNLGLD